MSDVMPISSGSPVSVGTAPAASAAPTVEETARPRHASVVRVTHWLTAIAFLLLLVTGVEILISHPRFYWGETGNVNMTPLFSFHIPSSRESVPTGYGYTLPDANGWGRYLHFQSAWLLVLTGAVYFLFGLFNGHFRRNLFPALSDLSPGRLLKAIARQLRTRPSEDDASTYNLVQRLSYVLVVFVAFPLIIWTGLAMSPAFDSAFHWVAAFWGGKQSARTMHFFLTVFLVLFLLVHIVMVFLAGFRGRVGAMITGRPAGRKEQT